LAPDGTTQLDVPLCFGPQVHPRRRHGVSILRDRLDPSEVVSVHGIPCVREKRALFDAMRTSPDLREAVVAMDMMAAAEVTSIRRMREYVAGRSGWDGAPLVRAALDLASEHSRSPNETRMRLVWELDAELPRCRHPGSGRGRRG
jgi:hypothetical protein